MTKSSPEQPQQSVPAIPRHLALIPDGNRRWARSHNLPVLMGHRRVMEQVFPALVTQALESGIQFFTLWGFSTENWSRDQQEVDGLFHLFDLFFSAHGQRLHQQGIRIIALGRRDNLSAKLLRIITKWEKTTQGNTAMQLNIAFNYGGQDEIIRATQKILTAHPNLPPADFTPELLAAHLDTGPTHIPDPDLIIRTSGEQRLSGFFSWQAAYAELYFSPKPMPDWTPADLLDALADYSSRQRRYGH